MIGNIKLKLSFTVIKPIISCRKGCAQRNCTCFRSLHFIHGELKTISDDCCRTELPSLPSYSNNQWWITSVLQPLSVATIGTIMPINNNACTTTNITTNCYQNYDLTINTITIIVATTSNENVHLTVVTINKQPSSLPTQPQNYHHHHHATTEQSPPATHVTTHSKLTHNKLTHKKKQTQKRSC